jgi:large subunit ribosomal protein L10
LNRDEKAAAIAELSDHLKEAEAIFAVDYRGISVTDAAELRGKLREADAVFKVVKNRLAKRAAADAGTEGIDDLLIGPTALTLIKGDAVIAAKAISDFAKEHEELEYKGGIMDGAALDPDGFKTIARLPGLDALRGQLVGIAASPLTGLVAGLNNMISGLGRQLAQMAEQGLVTGEAPAAEQAEPEQAEAEPAEAEQAEEAPADEPQGEEPAEEPAAEQPTADGSDSEQGEELAEEPAAEQTDVDPDTPGSEAEDVAGSDSETETSEEVEAEGETSEDNEEE